MQRDIAGFEGRYAITSDGRVWSYPKAYAANSSRNHRGRWLKQGTHPKGYANVDLCDRNGKHVRRFVHRLVAAAFLPNPDRLPQVNHRNFNKKDNRVENLEWCSALANVHHAFAGGRHVESLSKRGIA